MVDRGIIHVPSTRDSRSRWQLDGPRGRNLAQLSTKTKGAFIDSRPWSEAIRECANVGDPRRVREFLFFLHPIKKFHIAILNNRLLIELILESSDSMREGKKIEGWVCRLIKYLIVLQVLDFSYNHPKPRFKVKTLWFHGRIMQNEYQIYEKLSWVY